MRKLISLILCLMMGISWASAQTKKCSGMVVSAEDGEPVIGASVLVKGTQAGTITDAEGRFTLDVPESGKTYQVSYIGMQSQEVAVASHVKVVLQSSAINLDDVVVTALGIKRETKALGYAATAVNADQLTATGDRSALNALQGKMAGVEITTGSGAPGASTRVILRGFTSIGGNNQPLYVIDGVPVNNDVVGDDDINGGYDFGNRVNDINPEDIESMTVLKGAAGSAMYGSRAANGVIVITTKKGSNTGGKVAVDFSSTTTFSNPLRLPKLQNDFGQGWYGRGSSDLEENGSWGPKFDGVVRPWGHVIDNQQLIKPYSALEDNMKDFFETGISYNNNVAITSGDENRSFYVSYGNVTDDGILPGKSDSYQRNSLAVRGSTKFMKIFTASASLNYVRKDSKYAMTGQSQSVMDALLQTPRDISLVEQENYKDKFFDVDNYYTLYAQNPYYILGEHGMKLTEDRVFGNFGLEAKVLPWLTASFKVGADVSNSTMKSWLAITDCARADYNDDPGKVGVYTYRNSEINTDFMLKSHNMFLDNELSLDVVLGHNLNERESNQINAEVIGLDIPGYYNLANSSTAPTVEETYKKRRLVGLYGSVDLGWRNMLYLTLTSRNDWSSTLPKNNRSFFYPAVSASFVFSELLKDQDILSFGKVRVGYAEVGNDADPYLINSVYVKSEDTDGYSTNNYPLSTSVNGFTVSNRIGNNSLQPEISKEYEIGVDVRFLDNRIALDAAYYDRSITDLIWNASLPSSTGFTSQVMNLGKITNKGFEASLTLVPVKTKDWTWEVTVNYTRNKNKLVSLTEGLDQIALGGTSSLGFMARPGQALGLFEGSIIATDDEGHIICDAQGLPTYESELGYLGSSQNKYQLGGSTKLSWKGFTLNAVWDYRHGGKMYSRTAELCYFTGNALQTTYNDRQPFIIPNSVQLVDGQYVENTTPVAGYDNNLNLLYNQTYMAGKGGSYSLIDKTFLKLRELSLTWDLPKKWLASTPFTHASVALVGRNLLMWTPDSNVFVDPESTTFGNDLSANYGEYGATPTTRNYGFSVKFGF